MWLSRPSPHTNTPSSKKYLADAFRDCLLSHMLEKACGYATKWAVGSGAGTDAVRSAEVVWGHRRLRGFSHSEDRPLSSPLVLRDPWHFRSLIYPKGVGTGISMHNPNLNPGHAQAYTAPPSSALCLHFWDMAVWKLKMKDHGAWERNSCVCVVCVWMCAHFCSCVIVPGKERIIMFINFYWYCIVLNKG